MMVQRDKTETTACTACRQGRVTAFFEIRGMPIRVNFLHSSKREATECPRGDIVLGICNDCGLISNVAFDPAALAYGEAYENSLHFSAVFQGYAESLADRLIDRFDLRNKTIVEIGCGGGEFLSLLCERGNNRGIGFDPSHSEGRSAGPLSERVRIIREYYSEDFSDIKADFVCSRHTLEHIKEPTELLGPLRRSIGAVRNVPVFFEVPNGGYTLRCCFIWDIIYEHTSYFTERSLKTVFEIAGFDVARTYEAFEGQYLCIEAFPGHVGVGSDKTPGEADHTGISTPKEVLRGKNQQGGLAPEEGGEIEKFRSSCDEYMKGWKKRIGTLVAEGGRVVLWGAGSKGVTFLNMPELGLAGLIETVIDMNPAKHGMFVAGTGQPIVPPDSIRELQPDTIVVANPVYRDEVERIVREMGASPAYLTL